MANRSAPTPARSVVTLPADTIFKIQIVEPVKPPTVWDHWRPLALRGLMAVLLIAVLLWLVWVTPISYAALNANNLPELSLAVAYPPYLSRGDEGTIDLTATNVASQTITGTVIIDFAASPQIMQVEDSANLLKLDNLPPGGKQTLHVRYRLAQPMGFGNDAFTFTPRATLENGSSADYDTQTINITFLPLVRTILTGTFGLSALAGLFWDQIKKRLFPAE